MANGAAGSEERMATDGIWGLMFRMALPAIIAQVINILYNIVDRMYIGHIPGAGSTALTGVGVTFAIVTFVSAFSAFVGSGGAPLAAISMGKGDKKNAERILGNGVCLLIIFTCIIMAFFYSFEKPFLYMFGASDATYPYASEYIKIYLAGTIFVEFALGLNPYIICQGKSKTAMLSVLIGAIINIALDPLFIFVFDMGVKGAALATVISQFFSAVWVVAFLAGRKSSLRIRPNHIRLRLDVTKQIFALGLSPFIMSATECLISLVLNRGLQKYGGDIYVGTLTIMQSVMMLIFAPVQGFTQGVQPILSYNFGAGLFARVKKTYKRLIGLSFSFTSVLTLTTMLFPTFYASMFTEDDKVIRLVGECMPVFMAGMLVFGIQSGIQPTFISMGQAKLSIFIAVLRKLILLIPLAIILPHFFGVMGIYYAEPISDVLSASTAAALFALNIKKMMTQEYLQSV
ncbi:MAG: MATE family efflux transporter [Lachnospiraceae bacterium]|nr:MATE family efflux transporter [Lachnospiraceae bacterium]